MAKCLNFLGHWASKNVQPWPQSGAERRPPCVTIVGIAPMELISDREMNMATTNRSRIHRLALATLGLSIAWMATVSADNLDPAVATSMVSNAPEKFPDVTSFSTTPPTDQELAGDSVYQFIVNHATKKSPSSNAFATSPRWRGGRPETICPVTLGLDAAYNSFVSARLRAMAAYVGAPVQPDLHCNDNVQIVFTTEPDKLMDEVIQRAAHRFGVRIHDYQIEKQEAVSSAHAVQAWFLTTEGRSSVWNADATQVGPVELQALWPRVIVGGCCSGGIVGAIFVIDTAKVAGYTIGSIADYVSMLALSPVENPDHCDPLPSILDLMAPSCGAREKPAGVTAGDLAFLKALYYHNTGVGPSLRRNEMQTNMMRQFKGL